VAPAPPRLRQPEPEKSLLLEKEQFYLTELNPPYNILKIAGSSKGFKHSEKSKSKISISLLWLRLWLCPPLSL
jgi:hypothetical protein